MRALLLVALVALLAGCTASPGGWGATREPFVVVVTDEPGGPPVEGALVTAMGFTRASDEARTDAQGRVTLHAYHGDDVAVAKPGFVPEQARLSGSDPLVVALYRDRIVVELTGTLEAAGVRTRGTPAAEAWDPQPVPFGRNDEARKGYASRLLRLDAALAWENAPGAAGDLALGLGRAPGRADVWHDSDAAQLAPGPHEERVVLTGADFEDADWEGALQLHAGPAPAKAYAAPQGLPYRMTLDAQFGQPRESPGAPLGAIVALAAAALLLARREPA